MNTNGVQRKEKRGSRCDRFSVLWVLFTNAFLDGSAGAKVICTIVWGVQMRGNSFSKSICIGLFAFVILKQMSRNIYQLPDISDNCPRILFYMCKSSLDSGNEILVL